VGIRKTEQGLNFKVSYAYLEDGSKPEDGFLDGDLLKKRQPKVVFDYYESKMKFVNNK